MDEVDIRVPVFHIATCAGCDHEHVCRELLGLMVCGSCERDEDCGRLPVEL